MDLKEQLRGYLQELFRDKQFLASCLGNNSSTASSTSLSQPQFTTDEGATQSNGSPSSRAAKFLSNLPPRKKLVSSNSIFYEVPKQKEISKKERPFFRDLILLKTKNDDEPLSANDKEEEGCNGYVREGFKIDRDWDCLLLSSKVQESFNEKLGILNEIIFLKRGENGKLRQFFTEEVTGELIYHKCQGDLYIRPKFDLLPEVPTRSGKKKPTLNYKKSEISSDEDVFVVPVKKKKISHASLQISNSSTESDAHHQLRLPTMPSASLSEGNFFKILEKCRLKVKNQVFDLTVNRKTVLFDLLKKIDMIGMNSLKVTFHGESGCGSGLIKDFFSIALRMLKNHDLLEGGDCIKTFKQHKPSMEQGLYEKMGKICALSMIHSGLAPSFFSPAFAKMLLGIDFQPTVEDILNQNIKSEIESTMAARTVFEANTVMANCMIFQSAGTHDQIDDLEVSREKAVKDTVQYMVQARIAEEISAFAKCLDHHFNLLSQLKAIPHEAIRLFVHSKTDYKLTTESLLALFSADETTERSRVYGFFVKYLQDAENQTNKEVKHTLEEVLFFSCGVTSIPPLGFGASSPKLTVANIYFPKSRICFNEVQLPNLVDTYDEFIVVMDTALITLELSG